MMAFLVQITTGTGGEPVINLANSQNNCSVFDGTSLPDCPAVGEDIRQCQEKYGKKVLLSIGGATYTEGGFGSPSIANSSAQLVWNTFGPPNTAVSGAGTRANHTDLTPRQSPTLRPFGDVSVDGFDFDFESPVQNVVPFASALRSLMDRDTSKQYYLTAAPQCPFPDLADQELLRSDVPIDAVFVQFYNNYCGLTAFQPNASTQATFNFHTWDSWAAGRKIGNGTTSVYLGVPAASTAAGSGYVDAATLKPIVEYSKKFASFGGIMMWDASQAVANGDFLSAAKSMLA